MTAVISLTVLVPTRVPERLAWACSGLAVAGLVASLSAGPRMALDGHAFEDTATALIWAFLAALLARRTSHRAVAFFLAVAIAAAVAVAGSGYGMLALPGSAAAAWLAGSIWPVSTFVPVILLAATFPSGRLRSSRALTGVALLGLTGMVAALATGDRIETTPDTSVANPLAVPVSDGAFLAGSALILISALGSVLALWRRARASRGLERRQFAPVAVAVTVTVPALLAAGMAGAWAPLIQLLIAPLVPGAVTLAILQYRLYDVEVVVRRSVVFAGLTALVVGGYVLVVQAAANLLHHVPGTLASVVAVGAVALAFAPARSALQRTVGVWVYGDRDHPDRALADVGGVLTAAADPGSAMRLATERLQHALRVPWVVVEDDDGRVAEVGTRPGWAGDTLLERVRLRHLGSDQGSLVVVPRTPGEPLDARDHALLAQLGTLIAAVLASRRLVADLQHSREEVVLGREEERRRVRRDLHDGVGPLLSALSTHADVAALRFDRAPDTVPELLDRIRRISEDASTGLRQVVEDLQPVRVDDLGLVGALRELGALMGTDGVTVRVTGEAGTGLPAAVEVAAYRIVSEALHNALRHANPRSVEITLERSCEAMVVTVRDDGHGTNRADSPRGASGVGGVGLVSMRRRAEELGGTFRFVPTSSGTVVETRLPLRTA